MPNSTLSHLFNPKQLRIETFLLYVWGTSKIFIVNSDSNSALVKEPKERLLSLRNLLKSPLIGWNLLLSKERRERQPSISELHLLAGQKLKLTNIPFEEKTVNKLSRLSLSEFKFLLHQVPYTNCFGAVLSHTEMLMNFDKCQHI